MTSTLQAVVKALGEQSFMAHILAKLGILQPGELKALCERSPERAAYIEDFLKHMASLGVDLMR